MPIDEIKKKIYLFIRDYSEKQRVNLYNIKLFAKHNHIKQQEMGYALQLLKESEAVYYSKKYGWMTR